MKRIPIIIIGQIYLHVDANEYIVVTKSTRGDIQFKGKGISGMHEHERFLQRFQPVDPADLEEQEAAELVYILDNPKFNLSTGWIVDSVDVFEDEDEEELIE